MSTAFVGLGSNKGDRVEHLRSGVSKLHERGGIEVQDVSPVYESEAHTRSSEDTQLPFLNAVLQIEVNRSPEGVLRVAQAIEHSEGRSRTGERHWQSRVLDIDLLAVDTITQQTNELTLPHPRLGTRRFVLRPWADLAPDFLVPPPFDETVRSLLRTCSDTASLVRTDTALGVPADTGEWPPSD